MKDHLTFLNAAVEFRKSGDETANPGRDGEVQAQELLRSAAGLLLCPRLSRLQTLIALF